MRGLGKGRRQHPGHGKGKAIGIKRGGENVGEFAGREGLERVVLVDRVGHWMGHGGGSSGDRGVQHGGCG